MTQTTGAMSWENARVEISTDANFVTSAVINISGSTNRVATAGGEINPIAIHNWHVMAPKLGYGKRDAMTITIGVLYTEVATEAFLKADALYRAKTPCWLRVTPDAVAGTQRFVSSAGKITTPPPIGGEAGTARFVAGSFAFVCGTFTPEEKFYILLETGGYLLLEDGTPVLG